MHVDQAEFVFDVRGVKKGRYDFVLGDVFKTDFREFGTFDVVLYLGFFYLSQGANCCPSTKR